MHSTVHSTVISQQERSPVPVPPPARRRPQGRLAALDGLRLLAALMVVAYHYLAFNSGAWPAPSEKLFPVAHVPASYGWLGVQLFFLISGFVICMSAWGKGVGDFAVSRATRLYPAYWFAVLAVSLAVSLFPVVNEAPRLSNIAVNLTMLQDPFGVAPVDGVYWTLWVEVRFYLLFALVVAWHGLTYRRAVAFCLLWGVGAAVASTAGSPLLTTLLMPGDAWYFIAGIAFYLMHRFRPNLLLWLIVAGCFLAGQRFVLEAHRNAEHYMGHRVPQWPSVLLLALFFGALAAVALGLTRRITWGWLSTAGVLTYPLYLLHERMGWIVIKYADGLLPRPLLLMMLVMVMLAAAWLVHRLVERPLARLVRQGLRRALAEIRAGHAQA
ncbi:acyltransferase family protein [Streptoverticillium reticulum]|uniref:acyltransferase family protein n=1 Tax=Streptomyces TaxID=1883 RepID=UPI0036C455C4